MRNNRGSAVIATMISVLALITSITALALAWTAYNKFGEDLEGKITDQAAAFKREINVELAELEARGRLLSMRAQVMAEEGYEELAQEASETRQVLEQAYGNAAEEARKDWRDVIAGLQNLEDNLRSESSGAIQDLQNVLEVLQRDVQTDDN